MRPWGPALTFFALAMVAGAPAFAQPSDPFAAIVGDADGANAALNDLAVPLRNPTEAELRQYLAAFQVINVSARATVASPGASVQVPFGPFQAETGTQVGIRAGFEKRPGERDGVLRTLELTPTKPLKIAGIPRGWWRSTGPGSTTRGSSTSAPGPPSAPRGSRSRR